MGRDRTEELFVKYFINIIDNDEDMTKSDRVNLTKIDLTVEESLKLKLAQEIIMQTSTSAKDFEDRFYTKQMLIDNIKHTTLSEKSKAENKQVNINKPTPTIKNDKPTIIAFLVKWRIAQPYNEG